jgi:hypothetical protein
MPGHDMNGYGLNYTAFYNSSNYYNINSGGINGGGGSAGMGGYWNFNSQGGSGGDGFNYFNYYGNYIQMNPQNSENFLYDPNNWFGLGNGALAIGGVIYQNYYSDAKYKDNVTAIPSALAKVNAMRGVEFDWNALAEEEQGRTGHDVGVIAQEVQAVYPIAVREVDKEREENVISALVVDYEKLIPLLLQSIKELSAEVNTLKQQINGANI